MIEYRNRPKEKTALNGTKIVETDVYRVSYHLKDAAWYHYVECTADGKTLHARRRSFMTHGPETVQFVMKLLNDGFAVKEG